MSLPGLADVEVQSMMLHFLRSVEILRVARCCSRLGAVAFMPFAWRHAILDLHTAAILSAIKAGSAHRLRDLAPRVSLQWRPPPRALGDLTSDPYVFDPAALAACGSHARSVVELTVLEGFYFLPADDLKVALQPPAFRSVRTLHIRLHGQLIPGALQVLQTSLPQLTELNLDRQSSSRSQLLELADFPLLISLGLRDNEDPKCSFIAGIMRCTQLRHLRISAPHMTATNCKEICASPGFRGLETLCLNEWSLRIAGSAVMAAVLALRNSADVSLLLPMLVRIPKLERLICEPGDARFPVLSIAGLFAVTTVRGCSPHMRTASLARGCGTAARACVVAG